MLFQNYIKPYNHLRHSFYAIAFSLKPKCRVPFCSRTYLKSDPGERRVLLGSICPSGLAWRYSGLSNQQFSPQYQAILDVREDDFALSTASGS